MTYFSKTIKFVLILSLFADDEKSQSMQVQRLNEFSQVRTRVCDTYCSHHLNAFGINRERERKVNMCDTRSKICLIQSSIISMYN